MSRPAAEDVKNHCLFWSEDDQKDFFIAVYDFGSTENGREMYWHNIISRDIFTEAKDIDKDWTPFQPIPKTYRGTTVMVKVAIV